MTMEYPAIPLAIVTDSRLLAKIHLYIGISNDIHHLIRCQ